MLELICFRNILKNLTYALLICLVFLLPACSKSLADFDRMNLLDPSKRDSSPNIPDADYNSILKGNQQFAFDFYHEIHGDDGNLLFSPYSLSSAMSMAYAGARGNSAKEFQDVLHFLKDQKTYHSGFNLVDSGIMSIPVEAGNPDKPLILDFANSIWVDKQFMVLPTYIETLQNNYGALLANIDLANDPGGSCKVINDYIEKKTRGLIPGALDPGALGDAVTVLVNTVYFKGAWVHQFEPSSTKEGPFYLLDGNTVSTPMMAISETYRYQKHDEYSMVELPYDPAGSISMLIVYPAAGMFEKVELALDPEMIGSFDSSSYYPEIELKMPKFEFENRRSVADNFAAMGMSDIFDPDRADFSAMSEEPVFISDIFHQAKIIVDEEGTEAAAATEIIFKAVMAPMEEEKVVLTIDHPFIFFIRDVETGSILFMGRVMNPLE